MRSEIEPENENRGGSVSSDWSTRVNFGVEVVVVTVEVFLRRDDFARHLYRFLGRFRENLVIHLEGEEEEECVAVQSRR